MILLTTKDHKGRHQVSQRIIKNYFVRLCEVVSEPCVNGK